MFTRKTALIQAHQFLNDLKAFGSIAKGRQHALSDLDLAVWDPSFSGVLGLDYERILPVLRPCKMLELHTFHPDETPENTPFVKEIVTSGIEIPV
jgi:hypothetical protein